jgi:chromosome segregation ATPase
MPDPAPTTLDDDDWESSPYVIAGFGPPPEGYVGVPTYALRVLMRQRELKAKVREINELLAKAEAERDGAVAQLGQSALDYGLLPDMAEAIERKVSEAERSISAARGRTSQEAEHHKKELARLDGELAAARTAIAPLLDREKAKTEEVEETEENLRHLQGMIQRLQIEQRNLEQAKGADAAGAAGTDRLIEIQSELGKLQISAQQEGAKLAQLQREATAIAAELAPLQRKLTALDDARKQEIQSHEEKLGQHSEESKRAFAWRRSQLAIAGRKVLEFPDRPKLVDADRLYARISSSQEKVEKIGQDLELHLKALDSFDRKAFERARVLGIVAAGVSAVLLLVVLLVSC